VESQGQQSISWGVLRAYVAYVRKHLSECDYQLTLGGYYPALDARRSGAV